MRKQTTLAVVLASLAACPLALVAQARIADSLLEHGALSRAESLYFAAVRSRPRDPAARSALARYLVERGAPRVGMTLFEEALRFGAEPATVSTLLAPLYLSLGEYHSLLALPASRLSRGEVERARWLESRSTTLVVPDTALMADYQESPDSNYLGRVTIRINGRAVQAVVSVHARGIVVSETEQVARTLRRFTAIPAKAPAGIQMIPAVADSIGVGRLALTNYPVVITALSAKTPAVIGLDVLGRFAPTFDPAMHRMTMRASGRVAAPARGTEVFPTRLTRDDLLILRAGGWVSAALPQMTQMLSGRRWTFDARRGQIVVDH